MSTHDRELLEAVAVGRLHGAEEGLRAQRGTDLPGGSAAALGGGHRVDGPARDLERLTGANAPLPAVEDHAQGALEDLEALILPRVIVRRRELAGLGPAGVEGEQFGARGSNLDLLVRGDGDNGGHRPR